MNKFAKLLEKMEPNFRQYIWTMSEQWHVNADRVWIEGIGFSGSDLSGIFRISNRWEEPYNGKPRWKLTDPDGAIIGHMGDILMWLATNARVRPPQ